MKNTDSIRPEDILADGKDYAQLHGQQIRKGTIAAFIANIDLLENHNASEQQKNDAINMLKELAPAVITSGLHKHVTFKNAQIERILIDSE